MDAPDSVIQPSAPRHQLKCDWPCAAVLVALVFLAYSNSFHVPFIFDDHTSITANPSIRKLWPPGAVLLAPPNIASSGRPVVNVSLAVNHALGGFNPAGYHLFNTIIHALAALVLFALIRRTLTLSRMNGAWEHRARAIAFASAAIWTLHPVNTQAVTYITGRNEALMALFYLLTLYSVARSAEGGLAWRVAAIAACALGMCSKEVMATAPLVALLYDRAFIAFSWRDVWRRRRGLHAGLSATWLILAVLVATGPRTATTGFGLDSLSSLEYAKNQAGVIMHYLRLAVWPSSLVFDYGRPAPVPWSRVALPGVFITALVGLAVWMMIRRPAAGFLMSAFFLILAPSSSFMPMSELAWEYRMYLPLAVLVAGCALLGAGALDWMLRRSWLTPAAAQWAAVGVVGVVVLSLGAATFARNRVYASEIELFRDAAKKIPDNHRNRNNLAVSLHEAGRRVEALEELRAAVRIEPDDAYSHYNLATMLMRVAQPGDAIAEFSAAVKLRPDDPLARGGLADALAAIGRTEDAKREYNLAIAARPDFAEAHNNLGVLLADLGRLTEAEACLRRALKINPGYADAHNNLGTVLAQQGGYAEAAAEFQSALRINPSLDSARDNLKMLPVGGAASSN